jgi:hypothetical protein
MPCKTGRRTSLLLRFGFCVSLAGRAAAQNIVADAAPSHAVNLFSPLRALGGAIDRLRGGATKQEDEKPTERLLTDPVLKELLAAGWGTVTYRQNTELMIEAWHWNPRGTWSNPTKQEGYFTGSAEPTRPAFEGTPGEVDSWADANGRVSFFGRFLQYLKARDRQPDFTFFSFEHYPCQGGRKCADSSSLYWDPPTSIT